MPGVGVDGIAEQQQLNERQHDDHRERHTIALELDKFLHQDSPSSAQKIAADPARRLRGQHVTH
jgi:hypothetical protein